MPSPLPAPDVDAFTSWTRATSRTTRAALFLCFVAVLLAGGVLMARVDAATLVVTTTNDSGPGSVRQALSGGQGPKKLGRTLTFAERVAYQYAIEEVYWRH